MWENDILFIYLFYLGDYLIRGKLKGAMGYSESVVDHITYNVHAVHYENMWDNEDIYDSDLITDVYTHVNKTLSAKLEICIVKCYIKHIKMCIH